MKKEGVVSLWLENVNENNNLIEESLKLIESMKLFTTRQNQLNELIELNGFEECKELAFDFDEYLVDDEYLTWQDIKELEMANVKEELYKYENYKEINEKLRKIGMQKISEIIYSNECREVWDDVYNDLMNCVKVRGILGKENLLFEKIFEVYLSGGWPCGWEGNFPNGKIKAFYLEK